jgi:hypothetical protein
MLLWGKKSSDQKTSSKIKEKKKNKYINYY